MRIILFLTISISLISPFAKAQVFINEIMVNSTLNNGSGMPDCGEWIEFYNSSSTSVDISCWFFTDGDFSVTFPSGTSIPGNGFYTVASAVGSGLTPNLDWATCGCTSGSSIGNFTDGNEQVLLYNSSGVLQDAVIWGAGQLPGSATTIAVGTCSSVTVTFPTTASGSYETINSTAIAKGISKERSYDGSTVWQNHDVAFTFGASNGVNPLPVCFINFDLKETENKLQIDWSTSIELNNSYFEIEQSYDGENFEMQKKVQGSVNSLTINNYSLQIEIPYSNAYYRIKQVDVNGNFSFSEIKQFKFELSNQLVSILFYPNPSNGFGSLKLVNNSKVLNVKIFNAFGQEMPIEIVESADNDDVLLVNYKNYPAGLYYAIVQTQDKIINKSLHIY